MAAVDSPRPPLFTATFVGLLGGQFLQALAYSSLLLLPLYLEQLGASRTEIGTLQVTVPALSGLLARPAVAWALDRWGRRPTVMLGTAALAASMAALAGVEALGPGLTLDRLLYGVGIAGVFSGYFTWAADLIPPSRRTEGLALFGVAGLLPLALLPAVSWFSPTGPELRRLFLGVGLAVAASLVLLVRLPEPPRASAARPGLRGVLGALLAPPLAPVWLAATVFSGLVALFMAFATVAAARRGVPQPALLWLTYACGAVGVRLLGARLPDRIGPGNLVAPALASYTCALLLAASAGGTPRFLLAGLLAGLGHGVCFPVLTSQVVGRVPPEWRGSGLVTFTGLWSGAELLVGRLAGAAADAWGDARMFLGAALVATACLVCWAALEHLLAGRGQGEPPSPSGASPARGSGRAPAPPGG